MLSVALEAAHEQPRVDQRAHHVIGRLVPLGSKAGEQSSHAPALEEVDLANQHPRHVTACADADQVGDRIQHNHRRVEILDQLLHRREMGFEAEQAGTYASEPQHSLLDPPRWPLPSRSPAGPQRLASSSWGSNWSTGTS